MTAALVELEPAAFARQLRAAGGRCWIAWDASAGSARASSPRFQALAELVAAETDRARPHEAVFLAVGPRSQALFAAFVHRTRRGQAQGGVRHWSYPSLADFLRDGLRLSLGMTRKCALAGLWWGGGKGLIARCDESLASDPERRRLVYAEFGAFVTSLRGLYVTAEDAGTTPADMAELFRHTRFATCIPPAVGGSGNPSAMTAAGVIEGMEAALDFRGAGPLAGKKVAMQGAGQVGGQLIEALLARGVGEIVAAEVCGPRCAILADRYAGRPVRVRRVWAGDAAILAEPCDVLAPNALGGVLDPKTIASIQAPVVCGAANNPLADEERDDRLLAERDVSFVPDYVANRMGIVACSNEQYGVLGDDPAILRHLDRRWPDSVYATTRRVLECSRKSGVAPLATAHALADERSDALHPVWGERGARLREALLKEGWERG
jgi:glutamate dehydrogenase/leucine dehydrogenase